MSESKIVGSVHLLEETKTYGAKGFRKRLLVLEQENGSFTNYIPIDLCGEMTDTYLQVGDLVEVEYRLNGRKWQRDASSEVKYFMNAEATGLTVMRGSDGPEPTSDAAADSGSDDDNADIPF